jgi:hypothetical protein
MFQFKGNKVKLTLYHHQNGILYDEKKKRFVDFRDMDPMSFKNYSMPFENVIILYII